MVVCGREVVEVCLGMLAGGSGRLQEYTGAGREGGGGLEGCGDARKRGKSHNGSLQQHPSATKFSVPGRRRGSHLLEKRLWVHAGSGVPLSMCSAGVVQGTTTRFCGIESILVKRKTKDMSNGKHKWWFVLHDDEAILCDLDAKRSLLEVQTSWKLEYCFKPAVPLQQAENINMSSENKRASLSVIDSICEPIVTQEYSQEPDNVETSPVSVLLSSTVHQINPPDVPDCDSPVTPGSHPFASDSN